MLTDDCIVKNANNFFDFSSFIVVSISSSSSFFINAFWGTRAASSAIDQTQITA